MSEKTKIKMLRPDEVWQPPRGAPPGNRNAWKTGAHRKQYRDARKQIAEWMRTTNALIAEAEKDIQHRHGRA
jgi:hypothetical protein